MMETEVGGEERGAGVSFTFTKIVIYDQHHCPKTSASAALYLLTAFFFFVVPCFRLIHSLISLADFFWFAPQV